jgi:O-antigen ligase
MADDTKAFYRIQSIFEHPLTLGQTMSLILPFFIYFRKYIPSFSFIILIVLIIISVILSGSRSSIIPLFIYVLFLFLIKKGKHALTIFVILLIGIYFVNRIEKERVEKLKAMIIFWDNKLQIKYDVRGSSIEMRQHQFRSISEKWKKSNPLTGCGRGYREYSQLKKGSDPDLEGYESILILNSVEQGIVGVISYFLLIISLFFLFYRKNKESRIILFSLFLFFILSIIMIGIKPYSFLLLTIFGKFICKFPPSTPQNFTHKVVNY